MALGRFRDYQKMYSVTNDIFDTIERDRFELATERYNPQHRDSAKSKDVKLALNTGPIRKQYL